MAAGQVGPYPYGPASAYGSLSAASMASMAAAAAAQQTAISGLSAPAQVLCTPLFFKYISRGNTNILVVGYYLIELYVPLGFLILFACLLPNRQHNPIQVRGQ